MLSVKRTYKTLISFLNIFQIYHLLFILHCLGLGTHCLACLLGQPANYIDLQLCSSFSYLYLYFPPRMTEDTLVDSLKIILLHMYLSESFMVIPFPLLLLNSEMSRPEAIKPSEVKRGLLVASEKGQFLLLDVNWKLCCLSHFMIMR